MVGSIDPGFRRGRWVVLLLTTCLLTAMAFAPTSAQGATHEAPRIGYSTYLGGSDFDSFPFTARDRFGNQYLAGQTCSSDFPTTAGAVQRSLAGICDAYLAKLSPDGEKLIYSTYLGGGDFDNPGGIEVDGSGNAYVAGATFSTDFPTTPGAFRTSAVGGVDTFVTKLNPSGSALVYSTYLGGTGDEFGEATAVDSAGRVTVEGSTGSLDFPVTKGAAQGSFAGGDGLHCGFPCDAFVARLNRAGSGLVYSTYLGGSADEVCCAGVVDRFGRTHGTGFTDSTDFPTTHGAFHEAYGGGDDDTFVFDLNSAGSKLVYATYLGGTDTDFSDKLTLDHLGSAYVTGASNSIDFPTTPGVVQPSNAGDFDGTLSKLDPSGSFLVYSTFLGGGGVEFAEGVAVDQAGNAYASGVTTSTDLPVTEDAIQPSFAGGGDGTLCFGLPCDGWIMKLSPDASTLLYSSYLGGSGDDWAAGGLEVDSSGSVYIPGFTSSPDFLTTEGAAQTTLGGFVDAFVTKIELGHAHAGPALWSVVQPLPTRPAVGPQAKDTVGLHSLVPVDPRGRAVAPEGGATTRPPPTAGVRGRGRLSRLPHDRCPRFARGCRYPSRFRLRRL